MSIIDTLLRRRKDLKNEDTLTRNMGTTAEEYRYNYIVYTHIASGWIITYTPPV